MITTTFNMIKNNLRALFYAFAFTTGIYISLQELHTYQHTDRFYIFTFLLLIIYLSEIFVNYLKKNRKVEINLDIHDDVNELSEVFHKIILPGILYASFIGFGYYNISSILMGIMLIFVFGIFYVLFINIKNFFQHDLTAETRTHYIYDVIKFLIFFNIVNTLANTYRESRSNLNLYVLLIALLSFIILTLMAWRAKKLHRYAILYTSLSSIVISGSYYLITLGQFSPLQISLSLIFLFYLAAGIIHHRLNNTLTREVLIEYLIVLLIVLGITLGIS